ncbi:glycosyltransferase [Gammaproteobacteria bacterium]|jgi:glycosyltransferase involved in cell wall biosynthesis|nr:glycosyltransferase [Gammaproteobacteria bacterium]
MKTKSTEGLSIVIPLFNENENVKHLVDKIIDFKNTIDFNFEIILVDGCSNDGTQNSLLNSIQSNNLHECINLVLMNSKEGYGHDIMSGLMQSKFNHMAWTHADLQTDLNDVMKGFYILKNNPSTIIVKGNRKGRKLIDSFLTKAMQIYTFFKIGLNIHDINAQPKIFSRDFYDLLISKKNAPKDFSLDLFMLIHAKKENYLIKSFTVKFNKRKFGVAKGGGGSLKNRIDLIKRTLRYINDTSKKIN